MHFRRHSESNFGLAAEPEPPAPYAEFRAVAAKPPLKVAEPPLAPSAPLADTREALDMMAQAMSRLQNHATSAPAGALSGPETPPSAGAIDAARSALLAAAASAAMVAVLTALQQLQGRP